jgi:hypothetical protein
MYKEEIHVDYSFNLEIYHVFVETRNPWDVAGSVGGAYHKYSDKEKAFRPFSLN